MRAILGVALMALLGVGAVWTGKHLPLPYEPTAGVSDRAQQVRLERQYARFVRRVRVNAARARHARAARNAWARSANGICAGLVRRVRAETKQAGLATLDVRLRLLRTTEETASAAVGDLDALPAPRSIARRVDRLLGLYRTELDSIDRLAEAFRAGDAAEAIGVLGRLRTLGLRDQTLASRLGANLCAYGFVDVG